MPNNPSPENITKVSSPITPYGSNDYQTHEQPGIIMANHRTYTFPRSKYPIANYISTEGLSKALKNFVKDLSSHHTPTNID